MSTKRPAPVFAAGLIVLLFVVLPTSQSQVPVKVDTNLDRLEGRIVQAERKMESVYLWLSDMENHSTLRLLHQELNAVEAGVEPSGSWPNYYSVLLRKLNREKVNPREVNKILDRMVTMAKKGKYFFPEQKFNLEEFYRDVEDLRPK